MHAKLHITEQKHFTDYTLNFRLYTIPPTRKHKGVKESHTKNKKKELKCLVIQESFRNFASIWYKKNK